MPDDEDLTLPIEPAATRHINRNVLTLKQQFALAEWARVNRSDCETLTNPKLAAMAAAALECRVTPPNIVSVLEACGIEKVKPAAPPTHEQRLAALEEKVSLMTGIIQGLREGLDLLRQPSARLYPAPQSPHFTPPCAEG